jgi:NTP pyrophosphatase (non-canonical NTP hydrolase)
MHTLYIEVKGVPKFILSAHSYFVFDAMKKILKDILTFRKERDWEQFHLPKNLAISLVLEANEVLELFQWTKDHKLPENSKQDLKEELTDTYYWLLLLAHEHGIDLEQALEEKMQKNAKKYPVSLAKGNATKYNKRT